MKLDFNLEGLAELEHKLLDIGVAAGATALRRAGREAMKPVQRDMKIGAGFDESSDDQHMRDSIKITSNRARGREKNTAVRVRVGPTKPHSIKALAQEYGTEKQNPDPFMRPALFGNASQVLGTFKTILAIEIEKAANS